MEVAQSKAPGSRVAGKAKVLVFPDPNTGNTTYKAVQRAANVICVGPMLQGLRRHVNDMSRGALVVYTIALTSIQAEQHQQTTKEGSGVEETTQPQDRQYQQHRIYSTSVIHVLITHTIDPQQDDQEF